MDKIILKNVELYGYHGYYKEENFLGQRFRITVEAAADLGDSKVSDELGDTTSYVDVYEVLKRVFHSRNYKLLEHLGHDIGKAILDAFPRISSLSVEIMKPEVPVPVTCDYFGIYQEFKRGHVAYLALGSNLGDREGYLRSAIRQLQYHKEIDVLAESGVYETEPVGYEDQERFLNMVLKIRTSLDARSLLQYCNHIEGNLLRKRDVRWGPRTIDVDILLYEGLTSDDAVLTLPHPRMTERAFVMLPLRDVADPGLQIGGRGVEEILAGLDQVGIIPVRKSLSE